jgi:hypothetical protein
LLAPPQQAYHGAISHPTPVTAEQVCLHLAGHLAEVKQRAKERICAEIDALTLDELYDVFESGRAQYGGEFNVEAINCVREIRKEGAETPYDGLRKLVYPQV